jgi:hypothetical protein
MMIIDILPLLDGIKLALNARKVHDIYYLPKDIRTEPFSILSDIHLNRYSNTAENSIDIIFPKGFSEARVIPYINIYRYSIRYSLSLLIFKNDHDYQKFESKSVYGGFSEVFSIDNQNEYKEIYNLHMSNLYRELISDEASSKLIICIDIKRFYDSVNISKISQIIKARFLENTELDKVQIEEILREGIDNGLIVGNLCDDYLANIYLREVDDYFLNNKELIYYARMCDDIKLIVDENHLEKAFRIFQIFEKLSLNVNLDKYSINRVSEFISDKKNMFKELYRIQTNAYFLASYYVFTKDDDIILGENIDEEEIISCEIEIIDGEPILTPKYNDFQKLDREELLISLDSLEVSNLDSLSRYSCNSMLMLIDNRGAFKHGKYMPFLRYLIRNRFYGQRYYLRLASVYLKYIGCMPTYLHLELLDNTVSNYFKYVLLRLICYEKYILTITKPKNIELFKTILFELKKDCHDDFLLKFIEDIEVTGILSSGTESNS